MILLAVGVVLCLVLFGLGVVAPRLSKRAERRVDEAASGAERGAEGHGLPGRLAERSASTVDRAADHASEAGRALRGDRDD